MTSTSGFPRNPRTRRTPALTKASAYLSGLSADQRQAPIIRLANSADVSYVTMWNALRGMRPASGARDRADPAAPSGKRPRAIERLASRLEQDLVQGRLSGAPHLPQIKELCARYAACFRTMRAALDDLCERRVLCNNGRRYAAALRPSRRPSLTFAVLIASWYEGPLRFVAEYEQEFMIHLDHESARGNVNIEVLRFQDVNGRTVVCDALGAHEKNLRARHDIDGYLLPVSFGGCLNSDVLTQLHSTGKPVVIVDEIGGCEMPPLFGRSGKALILRAARDKISACAAARALIALGHRHLAFFSLFHNEHWPEVCLEGLSETIAKAGKDFSLAPFLIQGTQTTDEYIRAGWANCPDVPLRRWFNEWKKSALPAFVQQLAPYCSWDLDQQIAYAEMRNRLQPLLKRALSDKSITCWIAPDTDAAWSMHDYIVEHRLPLSMIAFGWSPEVTKSRIASWDLNAAAAARAAIRFLAFPGRKLPGQKGMELRIDGMLAVRESLRAV
jgi:hypothetical protein